jgi:excinuclease UvrABC ATPase subunit
VFNCQLCFKSIGPKVSPVNHIINSRDKEYLNVVTVVDEWENETEKEVHSTGFETVQEVKVCPACAGQTAERTASSVERKPHSFDEKPAEPMSVTLAALVIDKALDRANQTSKRAVADSNVAVPLIKQFVEANKGFKL